MKAIHFVFCLCTAVVLSTFSSLAAEEDFKIFLQKFTSSASFQYSRIKFPLKSPIILLKDDGETERSLLPAINGRCWIVRRCGKDVLRRRREELTYPALRRMDLPIKSSRPDMMSRSLLCVSFSI